MVTDWEECGAGVSQAWVAPPRPVPVLAQRPLQPRREQAQDGVVVQDRVGCDLGEGSHALVVTKRDRSGASVGHVVPQRSRRRQPAPSLRHRKYYGGAQTEPVIFV